MHDHDNAPWHLPINAKLAEIAEASPERPSWYDAWQLLGPDCSEEQRLRVYQAVRDDGRLPAEAGFYLVSWQADNSACAEAETELSEIEDRLEFLQQQAGCGAEDPVSVDEMPAEYWEALEEYHDVWEDLYLRTLKRFGEAEMVDLHENDPDEFERRHEAGRQFFHGPETGAEEPDWMEPFLEQVARCLSAEGPETGLAARLSLMDDFWRIDVYLLPAEIVGGPQDGGVVAPGFLLDLEALRRPFEAVEGCGWSTLAQEPEGPYLWIDGDYDQHPVRLRIRMHSPDDEEPRVKWDRTGEG